VQQRAAFQPTTPFGRQAKRLGNHVGVKRDANAVAGGVWAFRVDHLAKGSCDVAEVIIVKVYNVRCGFRCQNGSIDLSRTEHSPNFVAVCNTFESINQSRIEPSPAPLL
jgi:hypothetical protein